MFFLSGIKFVRHETIERGNLVLLHTDEILCYSYCCPPPQLKREKEDVALTSCNLIHPSCYFGNAKFLTMRSFKGEHYFLFAPKQVSLIYR